MLSRHEAGIWRRHAINVCVCLVRQSVTPRRPCRVGYHRTVRAHIRSHLYGGPQGWNPHGSGRTVRRQAASRRPLCGYHRSVLPHLMVPKSESGVPRNHTTQPEWRQTPRRFEVWPRRPDSNSSPHVRRARTTSRPRFHAPSSVTTHIGHHILSVAKTDAQCE